MTNIRIVETLRTRKLTHEVTLHFGTVDVPSQVVSYLRRRVASGEVLSGRSRWTCRRASCGRGRSGTPWRPALLERAGIAEADIPGAVHAAEHAAIGLLPLWRRATAGTSAG